MDSDDHECTIEYRTASILWLVILLWEFHIDDFEFEALSLWIFLQPFGFNFGNVVFIVTFLHLIYYLILIVIIC